MFDSCRASQSGACGVSQLARSEEGVRTHEEGPLPVTPVFTLQEMR